MTTYDAKKGEIEHSWYVVDAESKVLGRLAVGLALLGAINWIPKWYRPGGELSSQEIAEQFADFFLRSLYA